MWGREISAFASNKVKGYREAILLLNKEFLLMKGFVSLNSWENGF
jgi:hypothetical protein